MAVRINFHDGDRGTRVYDKVMQAFAEENGYFAEHYDGYYQKYRIWESELTGWLGAHGYPCLAWQDRSADYVNPGPIPMGIELEDDVAVMFWMKWT